MKNRFTIGQMAKIHQISVKTLRYYDEINLFKPIEVDKETGYRFYSTEQFEQLNTINYLKFLGLSLKEIKNHLDNRDVESFLFLLKKEKEITRRKIEELALVNKRFQNRIKEIEEALKIKEVAVLKIKQIQERPIIYLREDIYTESDLELALLRLEKMAYLSSSIIIGKVGLTIGENNLKKRKYDEYNSIFILLEEDITNKDLLTKIPAGEFACIYHKGNHTESPKYYDIVLNYLNKEGFEISGDAIERTIIDQYISKNKEHYLTEIQIPVQKTN